MNKRAFQKALEHHQETTDEVEPTEGERRNGWTSESLTQYVIDQKAAATVRIDPANRRQPVTRANSKYNPLRRR